MDEYRFRLSGTGFLQNDRSVLLMLIRNANAFLDGRFVPGTDIRTTGRRITEIGKDLPAGENEKVIDARGEWVIPGFVDVHTHAYGGKDTMNGEEAVRSMSRAYGALGVAAFLPTTMSATVDETAEAIKGIRAVVDRQEEEGAFAAGAHMEGPFLSPAKCGAQPKETLMVPTMERFLALCGGDPSVVRLITIAPELENAELFITEMKKLGIRVSAGHTEADAETVHRAADFGLDHATHTFNAMPPLHHRKPGTIGAALTDRRVYCEMICDGIHLAPDIVKMICAVKASNHALVITDSMEAAGMPDGEYSLGGQAVFVKEGRACLADGTLAGSTLTMPKALKNLIGWGIPTEDAVTMCTAAPADSIGLSGFGRIAVGNDSTLTRWKNDWSAFEVLR